MSLPIIIATIGTGTAGRYSNLAQGIVNGLRQAAPAACVLAHSNSPDSQAIAELVAEELAALPVECHLAFGNPDDLPHCRAAVRALIRHTRERFPDHRLILNPTSGTKQMTAGAVLAGIDERIGSIDYIGGERVDGVVKTGTERLSSIDTRRMLAVETGRNALALLDAGAWHGAAVILTPCADLFPQTFALAGTLDAWDRFDYRRALRLADGASSDFWKAVRKRLADLAEAPQLTLLRTADMLNFCTRALRFGRAEECLAAIYRLVEWFARFRLKEMGVRDSADTAADFLGHPALNHTNPVSDQLASQERNTMKDAPLRPGLALMLDLLDGTGFSFSSTFARRTESRNLLQQRQNTRYGHGTDFVPAAAVEQLLQVVRDCAVRQWPAFPGLCQQCAFPAYQSLVQEEIDHV
jgi:hypothetical protein